MAREDGYGEIGGGVNLVPITITDAAAFVGQHHRHHKPPQGGLFAVACAEADVVVGVAVVGRPVARMANDGWTAEVTRLCTTGEKNACSMLYAAAWRACRALGYRKLITYTLPEEGGHRSGPQAGSASGRLAADRGAAPTGRE